MRPQSRIPIVCSTPSSPDSRARIDPHVQPVTLVLGDVVCEAGGFLEYVYFPKGAVLSLLTVLASGAAIETANIGNEGCVEEP
jgi:hypothetical protein